VTAIEALNARDDVDVVIVTRGGGSLEDLWAFNDEQVARAIVACRHPVICGVGHETDFTIADLSADVRAPTPSAAAELAVPDRVELAATVAALSGRLTDIALARISDRRATVVAHQRSLRHLSPLARLREARQQVDDLMNAATSEMMHSLILQRERLAGFTARLESLNPSATLARGYAIVRLDKTEEVVNSVTQVTAGDKLSVTVSDGVFGAKVEADQDTVGKDSAHGY
jgi:exodeoxyribonuclease VII large subunit